MMIGGVLIILGLYILTEEIEEIRKIDEVRA